MLNSCRMILAARWLRPDTVQQFPRSRPFLRALRKLVRDSAAKSREFACRMRYSACGSCISALSAFRPCAAVGAPHRPKTATSEICATRDAGVRACVFFYFLLFFCEYSEVTKLYVGNLPFSATEDGVRALFSTHGTVEKVSLITDRDTGRARGFGFVEMSNSDAARAMQALNGKDFDGRSLRVNEAQERSGGGSRGPRRY
jgi:hypothetical protein